jgi:hypothetical protein
MNCSSRHDASRPARAGVSQGLKMHRGRDRSQKRGIASGAILGFFCAVRNSSRVKASPMPNSPATLGYVPRIEIPPSIALVERCKMTLTVAHISPIMSLIAGLLILIMPRLLNLIVAIFLVLNGLIGLGLLKWLHL